jgi:AdoMet-dependent heme synthase
MYGESIRQGNRAKSMISNSNLTVKPLKKENPVSDHKVHNSALNRPPRIISWNTTSKCNLKCDHCYMNASDCEDKTELTTAEGKKLIDEITELGRSILVLSGGEPLLRKDIFDLASYGVEKGLVMTMGTNGTLINNEVAKKLFDSGIRKIAISIDSSASKIHDEFRGVKDSWNNAVAGVNFCIRKGIDVQFNVTMTRQNYSELDSILEMAKKLGVKSVHLFFLVPTGRGKNVLDISPKMYEDILRKVLSYPKDILEVKPTCAPQFMRIAKEMNVDMNRWSRGCIAGISYCRILPDGSVTPCPYLPIKVGNIRRTSFKEIWTKSEVMNTLRDFNNLKGKCGVCENRNICGGCRARAYGLTSYCGGAGVNECDHNDEGDFLAEDPWCTYTPTKSGKPKFF